MMWFLAANAFAQGVPNGDFTLGTANWNAQANCTTWAEVTSGGAPLASPRHVYVQGNGCSIKSDPFIVTHQSLSWYAKEEERYTYSLLNGAGPMVYESQPFTPLNTWTLTSRDVSAWCGLTVSVRFQEDDDNFFDAVVLGGPECPGPDPDEDVDGFPASVDCDDFEFEINPGAIELVGDGIDQDCDGGDLCYADLDGDGLGEDDTVVSLDLDCDDPGEAAVQGDACPGFDDNLDDDLDGQPNGCDPCPNDASDDCDPPTGTTPTTDDRTPDGAPRGVSDGDDDVKAVGCGCGGTSFPKAGGLMLIVGLLARRRR